MERTPEGLIVPDGAAQTVKEQSAWAYEDYKMMRRAQKEMSKKTPPVHVVLYCSRCQKQIASAIDEESGQFDRLDCECMSRRVV